MKLDCPECMNAKCTGNITIKNGKCLSFAPDSVRYYQHKYYRSILLPEIADAMGETSKNYLHDFILKPLWLAESIGEPFYKYKEYSDVPVKFQQSGNIWKLDSGEWAVIPSMSIFTLKEAKSFIEFCEKKLFIDLNGRIREENEQEYLFLKNKLQTKIKGE